MWRADSRDSASSHHTLFTHITVVCWRIWHQSRLHCSALRRNCMVSNFPRAKNRISIVMSFNLCLRTRSIWKTLGPFATTSRRTPIHQVSPLYCRTPPLHQCLRRQRRQRQRVTEGTAMTPWNGPNYRAAILTKLKFHLSPGRWHLCRKKNSSSSSLSLYYKLLVRGTVKLGLYGSSCYPLSLIHISEPTRPY